MKIPSYTKRDVERACELALPRALRYEAEAAKQWEECRVSNKAALDRFLATPPGEIRVMPGRSWSALSPEITSGTIQDLQERLREDEVCVLFPAEYDAIKAYLPAARVEQGAPSDEDGQSDEHPG